MSGVALGLGISGLVIGVASTSASFAQAGAQKRKRDAATDAARKAMADARKRLDVNYMEDLGINKEVYDIARDRSMVSAAGLMESASEGSTRGVGSTAGQVYQQDLLGQQQVRAAQEGEVNRIEGLIAGEDSRLAGLQADLSLEEAAGAQQAARDAESARVSAIGDGVQSAISTVGSAADMVGLYSKGSRGVRQKTLAGLQEGDVNLDPGVLTESLGGIGGLSKRGAKQQFNELPKSIQKQITGSTAYQESLTANKLFKVDGAVTTGNESNRLTPAQIAKLIDNPDLLAAFLSK